MRLFAPLILGLTLLCAPALAQEDGGTIADRLERLERDLNFVQKQVYRGGGGAAATAAGGGAPVNSGQMQVRFSQIDEEIRKLYGKLEQVEFQNRQAMTDLKKLSEDVDFRLRAIEQKQAEMAQAAAPVAPPPPQAFSPDPTDMGEPKPATYQAGATEPARPAPAAAKEFPSSNAHYSNAFRLLNEKKFAEAGASFDAFIKKYPSDPLVGNAYYWLGETQYSRNDFTRSAESFRKGFEANPDGQKAADNLYKLAMSLAQTKRNNEACVVLAQVISKYGESAARTVAKATEARAGMQCK
jgi:tol-pal system protein YbgF